MASQMAQTLKILSAIWETLVQSLGWEDLLDEGMETHYNIFAWRIPIDRGASWATVHGLTKNQAQLSD